MWTRHNGGSDILLQHVLYASHFARAILLRHRHRTALVTEADEIWSNLAYEASVREVSEGYLWGKAMMNHTQSRVGLPGNLYRERYPKSGRQPRNKGWSLRIKRKARQAGAEQDRRMMSAMGCR
nr:hypothetical protein CFP56_00636 [Quercus suber]